MHTPTSCLLPPVFTTQYTHITYHSHTHSHITIPHASSKSPWLPIPFNSTHHASSTPLLSLPFLSFPFLPFPSLPFPSLPFPSHCHTPLSRARTHPLLPLPSQLPHLYCSIIRSPSSRYKIPQCRVYRHSHFIPPPPPPPPFPLPGKMPASQKNTQQKATFGQQSETKLARQTKRPLHPSVPSVRLPDDDDDDDDDDKGQHASYHILVSSI